MTGRVQYHIHCVSCWRQYQTIPSCSVGTVYHSLKMVWVPLVSLTVLHDRYCTEGSKLRVVTHTDHPPKCTPTHPHTRTPHTLTLTTHTYTHSHGTHSLPTSLSLRDTCTCNHPPTPTPDKLQVVVHTFMYTAQHSR